MTVLDLLSLLLSCSLNLSIELEETDCWFLLFKKIDENFPRKYQIFYSIAVQPGNQPEGRSVGLKECRRLLTLKRVAVIGAATKVACRYPLIMMVKGFLTCKFIIEQHDTADALTIQRFQRVFYAQGLPHWEHAVAVKLEPIRQK